MTVLVSDSFNRANSTTTLGTTDSYNGGTATAWQTKNGTWGILNNAAYVQNVTNPSYAYIDVGQSDVSVTTTASTYTDSDVIFFRVDPTANTGFLFNGTGQKLSSFNGSTVTVIASVGSNIVSGDVIKITAQGSSITVFRNGTQILTGTSTINQTSTKHGIGNWRTSLTNGSQGTWDNFILEDLSTGGTNATITSVVATATASSLAPTVSTQIQVSISSVVANSTASTLVPSISTDTSVSSVIANANASVIAPTVQTAQNISVIAPVSGATASAFIPSAGPLSVLITSVVASLTAIAIVPSVSIINTIIRTINLGEGLSSSINLRGSLSSSINLNGNTSPSINLRGGI